MDFVQQVISALVAQDMAALHEAFDANGLEHVWNMLRDYLFSVKFILGGLIPCLILQKFFPARERSDRTMPGMVMDYLYPVFIAIFVASFTWGIYGAMTTFYDQHLSFLNIGLLDDKPFWLQVIGAFLITDFMFYVSHWVRHKVPWLWYMHSIHHSQRDLNPMTSNRNHPLEFMSIYVIRTIPIAVVGGSFEPWAVYAILNNFWGYFIHANVRTNLGVVGKFIVSPQFHRVHHSREVPHFDKNFGERLVLWDWLFGTYYRGRDEYPETGVPGCETIEETSSNPLALLWTWARQVAYPFVKMYKSTVNAAARLSGRPAVYEMLRPTEMARQQQIDGAPRTG